VKNASQQKSQPAEPQKLSISSPIAVPDHRMKSGCAAAACKNCRSNAKTTCELCREFLCFSCVKLVPCQLQPTIRNNLVEKEENFDEKSFFESGALVQSLKKIALF